MKVLRFPPSAVLRSSIQWRIVYGDEFPAYG